MTQPSLLFQGSGSSLIAGEVEGVRLSNGNSREFRYLYLHKIRGHSRERSEFAAHLR